MDSSLRFWLGALSSAQVFELAAASGLSTNQATNQGIGLFIGCVLYSVQRRKGILLLDTQPLAGSNAACKPKRDY
jgi:hypothetical protein